MKNWLFTFILLISSVSIYAQDFTKIDRNNSNLNSKVNPWFFEGSVSFSAGTISQLGITPIAGYRFTPNVHGGISLTYYHVWDNTYPDNPAQSDVFGGSVLLRWLPIKEIFFQIEPAVYSQKVYTSITTYENKTIPFLFIGAGYNHYLNQNTFLTFQVKIDILNDSDSPYHNSWHPFFTAGVGFGL